MGTPAKTLKPLDLNALNMMGDEQRYAVVDYLDQLHDDLQKDGNATPTLMCGLEFVLQALGAHGYEWS